nr:phage protein NinX family protein [Citrobacter freundii]
MDYSKMSDFEINAEVFETLHGGAPDYKEGDDGAMVLISYEGDVVGGDAVEVEVERGVFNPCNNAAEAWPIIVGKKLSLINADDKWLCVPEDEPVNGVTGDAVHMIYSGDGVEHENPLRAAMIVFLQMQDSANVPANSTRSDLR